MAHKSSLFCIFVIPTSRACLEVYMKFYKEIYMKLKSILFAALAVVFASSCGQTAEERLKAFEETHEAMMTEYRQTMDSLSADPAEAEAYYNDFVEKYIEFNLDAAKKNPDNDVAVQVLMNLRGMI